jgi:spore coat protein U-like protein
MSTSSNVSTRLRVAAGAAVLALLAGAQPVFAQSVSANLGASATVTKNCTVSTSPVQFGSVNVTLGSAVDATGNLSITCTSGTAWTAAAFEGNGAGASMQGERRMTSSSSELLKYNLFVDSARSIIWTDDDTSSNAFSGTGTGSAQSKTIYARVMAGQTSVKAASYSDTVVISVQY